MQLRGGEQGRAERKQDGHRPRPWTRLGSRALLVCAPLTCKEAQWRENPRVWRPLFFQLGGLQGPERLSKTHQTSSRAGLWSSGNGVLRVGNGGGCGQDAQRRGGQASQMCWYSWLRLNPWPQTQIRSKPWAEGLRLVFARWRLQRARDIPNHSFRGTFPAIIRMGKCY